MNQLLQRLKTVSRKTWILVIAAAVLVAAVVIVLTATDWLAPDPYKNSAITGRYTVPDTDEARAKRYDLLTAEDAQAYFERLLNSAYIGLRGDVTQPAELMDGKWHMREDNGDGTALTAVFDTEGVITALSIGTDLGGTLQPSKTPYTEATGRDSIFDFLRAFAYEYLPDIQLMSGYVATDEYNDAGRFVTIETSNGTVSGSTHAFVVQTEPVMRIVGFRLLVDDEIGVIRSSRKDEPEPAETQPVDAAPAEAAPAMADMLDVEPPSADDVAATALYALMDAYDIPEAEAKTYTLVDVIFYDNTSDVWYGYQTTAPYWWVGYKIPGADSGVYSSYDILVDAATGQVLHIFDPSNNSNG